MNSEIQSSGQGILAALVLAMATPGVAMQGAGDADPADSTVVGNTGAAHWSVPIEVPAGPGGFTPSLAIRYSSRRGEGPFGVGWDLSRSEIACVTRFGVPAYLNPGHEACPQFELDGELLNPAGAGRYHTFVESFQQIDFRSATNHWEVTGMDGTTRRYGSSDNSRIRAPSGEVARWLLSELENPFGQKILYVYDGDPQAPGDNDPGLGFTYLSKITYGPTPASPEREIRLEYELRPDPVHDYSGGVERWIAYRTREITVLSHGQKHSRWIVGYDLADLGKLPAADDYTTRRSRLSWLQRFGNDCAAPDPSHPTRGCPGLPAQEFAYSDPKDAAGPHWRNAYPDGAGWETPPVALDGFWFIGPGPSATRFGDVNGDGLTDYVTASHLGGAVVRLNTGSRWGPGEEHEALRMSQEMYEGSLGALSFDSPVFSFSMNGSRICSAALAATPTPVSFKLGDSSTGGALLVPQRWDLQYDPTIAEFPGPAPSNPSTQLLGNFALVDLDADRRADLIMSIRLSGVRPELDCQGNELPASVRAPLDVRVAFRNTGSGWVRDDGLAEGFPLLGLLNVTDESEAGAWCQPAIGHEVELGGYAYGVAPCFNHVSFDPRFLDLNGDGRLDVLLSRPNRIERLYVHNLYEEALDPLTTNTQSAAWISTAGGWERATSFDLPFHHTHFNLVDHTTDATSAGPAGVRFADLNRDGYPDVVWKDPFLNPDSQGREDGSPGPGYASAPGGVLLNRGRGDGRRSSAWCSSRSLGGNGSAVEVCSEPSRAFRYELPAEVRIADRPLQRQSWPATVGSFTAIHDLNGDGWPDLSRGLDDRVLYSPMPAAAWLFDPGAPGESVWVRNEADSYAPPVRVGLLNSHAEPTRMYTANSAALELNGDGIPDWVRWGQPSESFSSHRPLPDLLREIRTGSGGTIRIRYAAGPGQRDAALEQRAAEHAIEHGEAPRATAVARWPVAVVAAVEVDGPNRAPSQTRYRYAHPRFCLDHRSSLGFRLIEKTRANGSRTTTSFYQSHGRAGRVSRREVLGVAGPLHSESQFWELVSPLGVRGAWAGDPELASEASRVGRLVSSVSQHEYGAEFGESTGARLEENYFYDVDSTYGHNFVSRIETRRPSGAVTERREAWGEPGDRVRGRVARRELLAGGPESLWLQRTDTEYGPHGKPIRVERARERRDGTAEAAPAEILFVYDEFGNLAERIDANGNSTQFCYDASPGTQPAWCTPPSNQASASVLVARRDPLGAIEKILPDRTFAVPLSVEPGYTDVPRTRVEIDRFGRVVRRYAARGGSSGPGIRLAAIHFEDDSLPPYVETHLYADARDPSQAIRSVAVTDGFGGTWKTIRDADVPGLGKYVARATYRSEGVQPGLDETRRTHELPCGDALCSSLRGDVEGPASVARVDALGRPRSLETPDGRSLWSHRAGFEEVVSDAGLSGSRAVDVVFEQNPKGDLSRRAFGQDRLLAVEACTNSDPHRTTLEAQELACASSPASPIRTLYGYHPNGQLEVIYDPIAALNPNAPDPRHTLRYHFDTAGRVIRIEDPDAGNSLTHYDAVGNVVAAASEEPGGAVGRIRSYQYDALQRLTAIRTPPGELDYTLLYRPGQLQLAEESTSAYTRRNIYDSQGRLWKQWLGGGQQASASYRYDLLGRRTHVAYGQIPGTGYVYEGAFLKQVKCEGVNCPAGDERVLVSNIRYDALGRREAMLLPGGTRRFEYSSTGGRRQLLRDSFWNDRGESTQLEFSERDALGNLLSWATRSTMGGLEAAGSYAYDHRNRLSAWRRDGRSERFAYDPLGNLIAHASESQNQFFEHPTKPHAITRRTEASGTAPAEAYAYDPWGNRISAGPRHYRYDSADRLICVSSFAAGDCDVLRVVYDAQGQRILEQTSTETRSFIGHEYVETRYAGGSKYRAEITVAGERIAYAVVASSGAEAKPPRWAFDLQLSPLLVAVPPVALLAWLGWTGVRGGMLTGVARRPGASSLAGLLVASLAMPFPVRAGGGNPGFVPTYRWVLEDPIGSGRVEVDLNGDLVRQTRFKPFGAVDVESFASRRRFFAGHPEQADTGLRYMRARWMSPQTGSFLSVDPQIRPADPQSHTGYSYAQNNPVSNIDPSGALSQAADAAALQQYAQLYSAALKSGLNQGALLARAGNDMPHRALGGPAAAGGSGGATGAHPVWVAPGGGAARPMAGQQIESILTNRIDTIAERIIGLEAENSSLAKRVQHRRDAIARDEATLDNPAEGSLLRGFSNLIQGRIEPPGHREVTLLNRMRVNEAFIRRAQQTIGSNNALIRDLAIRREGLMLRRQFYRDYFIQ